jgi:hypothetical protein
MSDETNVRFPAPPHTVDITQREAMYEAVVRRLNQMRPLHPLTDDTQREEVRLLGALATLYEKDPNLLARVRRREAASQDL